MNTSSNSQTQSRTRGRVGRLPDFLVIGARRAGTSSLSAYLRSHPSVFIAANKEVHYFDRHLDRGIDWYRDQFAEASVDQIAGEATPAYMYEPQIPGLMAQSVPDAKLIAILRDPVDRAYSHYWYNRGKGYESLSFERALEAEAERLSSGDPHAVRYPYTGAGLYFEQLKRVVEVFPRERLLILLTDDLASSPEDSYTELCRFLGVDETFLPAIVGEKRNRPFKSRKLKAVAKRLPRRARGLIDRANTRSYPSMPDRLRERLCNYYSPHDASLASWLGRDLSMWQSQR